MGSHAFQGRAGLGSRRRIGASGAGRRRPRRDEVSRNRRQELPSFAGQPDARRRRARPATAPPPARKRPRRRAPPRSGAPAPARRPAVEIWTDGACSGNPGRWGSAWSSSTAAQRREKGEYLGVGTNNIAELTAIERGIDLADGGDAGRRLRVYTDSSYAIGVLDKGWKAKANQELIARLKRRLAPLDVEFVKVAGHAGVPENERCDELARGAITGPRRADAASGAGVVRAA